MSNTEQEKTLTAKQIRIEFYGSDDSRSYDEGEIKLMEHYHESKVNSIDIKKGNFASLRLKEYAKALDKGNELEAQLIANDIMSYEIGFNDCKQQLLKGEKQ